MRSPLLILHILLLVSWLGIDVGVFTASFLIRRRGLSGDARVELRRLMRGLDLAPRLSLVLTMPVVLGLADAAGYATISTGVLIAVSAIAVAWAMAMVWSYQRVSVLGVPHRDDLAAAAVFRQADLVLRIAAIVGFGGIGLGSLTGVWEVLSADFLGIKSLLFASTVLAGLVIRRNAGPFTPALRTVVEHGETAEAMAVMDTAMRRVYPAVLYIWVSLMVLTAIAVIRPGS